jgi:hypothetical protein
VARIRRGGNHERCAPRSRFESPAMLSCMDHRVTALERAFQLARSERVAGPKPHLHSFNQIEGPLLRRQLADLIKAAGAGGMLE